MDGKKLRREIKTGNRGEPSLIIHISIISQHFRVCSLEKFRADIKNFPNYLALCIFFGFLLGTSGKMASPRPLLRRRKYNTL